MEHILARFDIRDEGIVQESQLRHQTLRMRWKRQIRSDRGELGRGGVMRRGWRGGCRGGDERYHGELFGADGYWYVVLVFIGCV